MNNLATQIVAARNLAAEREHDIRIKEFLRAITISPESCSRYIYDADAGSGQLHLCIDCHNRSWFKRLEPVEAAQLETLSPDELAKTLMCWIQDALDKNLLTLSDPPRTGRQEPCAVGAVVTYTFDRSFRIVASRWGD